MSHIQFSEQETILLHGGQEPDSETGSRAVPIYQTTSYVFRDTEHAQNLFGLKEAGNIYTRIGNPTVATLEERVAQLEDGTAAVATASGMAAITFAILNVAEAGDEIITDSNLYGGTYNLFAHTLPRYGINVTFVDGTNPENFRNAITEKTKAIFGETITNPSLNVFDVEKVAEIAHEHHLPLIIDNTFSPYFFQPLKWGADIVVHSLTKWIGGHGTTIGGIVVDGGRFDWNHEKFPEFTTPDESYHGLRYADLGPVAFATKLRVQLLRDIGASLSPHSAFLLLQGLETLHVRIKRHNENAKKVATFLQNHPAVAWVNYPGIETHPAHQLAKKYFKLGFGSMITFGINGGREAGRKAIDHVKLFSHVANVGDAKSLIIHPASTTHQQLSAEDLKKSGVSEELIRLSIGLESVDDIIFDLDQAISQATNQTPTIEQTEENTINWILHSPFIREAGSIRRKVIAISGKVDTATIKSLQKKGYLIITVDNSEIALRNVTTYSQIRDIPFEIDVLFVQEQKLSEETIRQFVEKKGKVLWLNQTEINDALLEQGKELGIALITNQDIAEHLQTSPLQTVTI